MTTLDKIVYDGFLMLAARLHVETCKECKKKYAEIIKHTLLENEKWKKKKEMKS